MASTLKSCPFCGSDDIDAEFWKDGDGNVGPGCMKCGASNDSAEAWNTRALSDDTSDTALLDALERALPDQSDYTIYRNDEGVGVMRETISKSTDLGWGSTLREALTEAAKFLASEKAP